MPAAAVPGADAVAGRRTRSGSAPPPICASRRPGASPSALRGEAFWDLDGYRTGTTQRILEATLTPEVRVTDGLLLRGEVRIDDSSAAVFQREDGLLRHYQPTLAVDALYVF